MEKGQEISRIVFIPSDQPTVVLQPSEKPLYLPAAPIPTQLAPVLGPRLRAILAVRGNQLDAQGPARLIQRIAVIGFVPNEFARLAGGEATRDQEADEGRLMRRSTCCG